MKDVFIDVCSNIFPVFADLFEVLKTALSISRQILISLLDYLFNDLYLRRLIGIFFASLLILLLFLDNHLSFHFLLDCGDHSDDLLIFLPCFKACLIER